MQEVIDILHVPNKDPNTVYHWFNASMTQQGDFNVYKAQHEGWKPVDKIDGVPSEVLSQVGQSVSNPGGGSIRRGDLVLYSMPREQWERTVHKQTVEARKKQETTLDTMVAQSQENAAKQLRDRGQKRIPRDLVFREDVGDPVD
jgi:hypothetical protein